MNEVLKECDDIKKQSKILKVLILVIDNKRDINLRKKYINLMKENYTFKVLLNTSKENISSLQ